MQEVFVLLVDDSGTMRSKPEPFGVAVTSEAEAKAFAANKSFGYGVAYERVKIFDSTAEALQYAMKN